MKKSIKRKFQLIKKPLYRIALVLGWYLVYDLLSFVILQVPSISFFKFIVIIYCLKYLKNLLIKNY